jgi:hypothetical protein
MKRILLSILISFGIVAMLPAVAMAFPHGDSTPVEGSVSISDGTGISGVEVQFTCPSATPISTTTGSGGLYGQDQQTAFSGDTCADGSTITATIISSGYTGSNTGVAGLPNLPVNIDITATPFVVATVPELNPITGLIGVIVAGLVIALVRRRAGKSNYK